MNKTISIIVVVILVVGAGIYLWQNFQKSRPNIPESPELLRGELDEGANWQTYRNEEYGFEVKYPKEVAIKEDDFSEPGAIMFLVNFGNISNNKPVKISVNNADMLGVARESIGISKEELIIVDGVKGIKVEGRGQKDQSPVENIIWVIKNNKLYELNGSGDVFNQILSTFKFTK